MTEPILFVPGLACTGRLFERQLAALADSHATSVADHSRNDTMAALAARCLAEAPERFALVGLSMGGYVALEMQRLAPGRVSRLALLDTSAQADGEEARANRERLIALAEGGRFDEVHRALWPRLVHPDRLHDGALEATVREMAAALGPDAFVRQQRAIMSRRDQREHLPSIEIPTLVLVGEADALTPPDLAREMAEAIEWASLVVVPRCGHLSTLEQPDAVTAALLAWLRS